MQILAKFSRKGIYYTESGWVHTIAKNAGEQEESRRAGRQAQTGHLGQKAARTRLLRTHGSSRWALPRAAAAAYPASPANGRSRRPRRCHSPSYTTSSPQVLLVFAASPTTGLKSSVGTSNWSSWPCEMLRKRVSGNFCFLSVDAPAPMKAITGGSPKFRWGHKTWAALK